MRFYPTFVIFLRFDANSGSVNAQPTISDSNSGYIPTTLTAEASEVVNATFQGSKWYKDDVAIPSATGLTYDATIAGTYKYEETWTDVNGDVTLATVGTTLTPFNTRRTSPAPPGDKKPSPQISSKNSITC